MWARETLEELQTRIRAVEAMDIPPAPPEPGAAPDCPEAFRGVPEERLLEQAARDGREFDRLTALRRRPVILDRKSFSQQFPRHNYFLPTGMSITYFSSKIESFTQSWIFHVRTAPG